MSTELNIAREMAKLRDLPIERLREQYVQAFGELTTVCSREWLIRRILWKWQANLTGGLSERAQLRAAELAEGASLRMLPLPPQTSVAPIVLDERVPPAGSSIVRTSEGRQIEIKVIDGGFVHDGVVYKTLSAVAKAITGSHCNGFLFFKLGQYGVDR